MKVLAKHATVPAPTNVAERVKRTILQVGLPALVGLVLILPEAIDLLDSELGEHLPSEFRLWMLGLAAAITAVSGFLVKLMALPRVNDWLSRWTRLGTVPPATAKALREADL